MRDRRTFVAEIGASLLVLPFGSRAQSSTFVRRIGVLSPGPPLSPDQIREAWAPLRELGWIEGDNLIFERRWASGRAELLRHLAEELVGLKVEIIATIGIPATLAAKNATATISIVMLSAGSPLAVVSWRAWLNPAEMSRDIPPLYRSLHTNGLGYFLTWRRRYGALACCSTRQTIFGISRANRTNGRAGRSVLSPFSLRQAPSNK